MFVLADGNFHRRSDKTKKRETRKNAITFIAKLFGNLLLFWKKEQLRVVFSLPFKRKRKKSA